MTKTRIGQKPNKMCALTIIALVLAMMFVPAPIAVFLVHTIGFRYPEILTYIIGGDRSLERILDGTLIFFFVLYPYILAGFVCAAIFKKMKWRWVAIWVGILIALVGFKLIADYIITSDGHCWIYGKDLVQRGPCPDLSGLFL